MFNGRCFTVATKHGKEKIIAPILEKEHNLIQVSQPFIDTDLLGTFTGEIERKHDPVTTLRMKCNMAHQISNVDIVVGTEGSFFPDNLMSVMYVHVEIIMFLDLKNSLEITESVAGTETNMNGAEVCSWEELRTFAHKIGFPTHSLILKDRKIGWNVLNKGINDWVELELQMSKILQNSGSAYAESDMRAMHNPTRMKVIEQAAKKLSYRLKSYCPECGLPGFGVKRSIAGLPCHDCGSKTEMVLTFRRSCIKCEHFVDEPRPDGKMFAEPKYCPYCNP